MAQTKSIKLHEMDKILSEYSVFRSLVELNRYNKEYFGNAEILSKNNNSNKDSNNTSDIYYIRSRMFELRRFVLSLQLENERLFLFYHYIHGLSVGRVADLMGIARSSMFRIKKRSLEYAAARYPLYLEQSKNGVR